jgi:hypothetical protein
MSQPLHDKHMAKLARLVGTGVAQKWSKIMARRRAGREKATNRRRSRRRGGG